MKLYVKNIGGLVGEHAFEVREGVNEVAAPNAAGKTTFIRSLLALLNPDDPNVRPDDLLNLDADEGHVRLEMGGEEYYRVFKRINGRVIEVESKPLTRDERFSWHLLDPFMGKLVSKVLAGEEDITDFIDATFKLNELRRGIDELRDRERELHARREELAEKSRDLSRLLKEREEIRRKLEEKEKEAREVEAEKLRVKEEIEKTIRELTDRIGALRGRLESYRMELGETEERIKDIKAKIQVLEERVDEFYTKYPDPKAMIESIDRDIDSIRSTIRKHEERRAEIENVINRPLTDAIKRNLPYCPLCRREVEEPEKYWERIAGELGKALKNLVKSIEKLREREYELLNKKGSIESEWTEIRNIEGVELPSLRERLDLEEKRRKSLEEGIEKAEAEIKVLENRIKELESRMPEEERRRIERIGIISGEVRALREYLEGLNRRIVALGEVGSELEVVEQKIAETIRQREELERRLYELRRSVVLEFRKIANRLVRRLGFTWFKSIALEESNGKYFIRIVRVFPSGREDKQSLRQLSTSERLSVALTAVLTGYEVGIVKDYPADRIIVLADEGLLAFDLERFNKVVEELSKYGKYVVITRLAEPSKTPKLTVLHLTH